MPEEKAAAETASEPPSGDPLAFLGDYSDSAEQPAGGDEQGGDDAEAAAQDLQTDEDIQGETQDDKAAANRLREKRIQELAAQYKVDANDQQMHRILHDLAVIEKRSRDKDDFIKTLQSPAEDDLTDIERELMGLTEKEEVKPKAEQSGYRQQTAQDALAQQQSWPGSYGDVGDKWKTPKDAYSEYVKAFEDTDYDKVDAIQQALHRRYSDAIVMPQVLQIVFRALQDFEQHRLGDVLPGVRQQIAEQRGEQSRVAALSMLRQKPEVSRILDEMGKTEDGDVEFGGQKFASKPILRIIRDNPWILDIRYEHPDPQKAAIMTWVRRYRAAMGIYGNEKQRAMSAPESAKQLIQAGAKMKTRELQSRSRTAVNSGGSRSGGPESAGDNYAASLGDADTVGLSVSSLLRR